MNQITVVWMDDQVRTYEAVTEASADERGQLVLSYQERIDRSRQGFGRPDTLTQRTVHIPLTNVRWWGQPGKEFAW